MTVDYIYCNSKSVDNLLTEKKKAVVGISLFFDKFIVKGLAGIISYRIHAKLYKSVC